MKGNVSKAQGGSGAPTEAGAGAHNAIYRGKFLGNYVTDEQYAAIAAGTFDDLYIGDYWTINGVTYRIAAFDYYYNTGENIDDRCTQHHVTLVPDSLPYSSQMNLLFKAGNCYAWSTMYTATGADSALYMARFSIEAAFSGHLLNHKTILQYANNGTVATGVMWYDSTVELMTEQNVFGSKIFGDIMHGASVPLIQTLDSKQFPLFALRPDLISNGQWYWLRDYVGSSIFAVVTSGGNPDCTGESSEAYARPSFSIVG